MSSASQRKRNRPKVHTPDGHPHVPGPNAYARFEYAVERLAAEDEERALWLEAHKHDAPEEP